jgi:hypothetical protein
MLHGVVGIAITFVAVAVLRQWLSCAGDAFWFLAHFGAAPSANPGSSARVGLVTGILSLLLKGSRLETSRWKRSPSSDARAERRSRSCVFG